MVATALMIKESESVERFADTLSQFQSLSGPGCQDACMPSRALQP